MKTLLLDTVVWDLVLDVSGNIALASEPYSYAQDAASAIKLFKGELWYDTAPGVPYFADVLGKGMAPPLALLKEMLVGAALRVPGVVDAQCFITSFEGREVSGQVQVTDVSGRLSVANF